MVTIALAGNPNAGKTTLFNALTGDNQFVGNWPGVTVERREGGWREDPSVRFVDLPGVYSLSPDTPEEVVTRRFLVEQRPDALLNLVDGTNLERNLYLTTQLLELGIPMVVAVNRADLLERRGQKLNRDLLSRRLGCPVVVLSAARGTGVAEAAQAAAAAARRGNRSNRRRCFRPAPAGHWRMWRFWHRITCPPRDGPGTWSSSLRGTRRWTKPWGWDWRCASGWRW